MDDNTLPHAIESIRISLETYAKEIDESMTAIKSGLLAASDTLEAANKRIEELTNPNTE